MNFLNIWDRVVGTWKHSPLPVKIHVSSPKEDVNDKRHHDFIDVERLMTFLQGIKGTVSQLDVMIEAKMKDEALLRLMKQLQDRKDCFVLDGSRIEL